MSLIPSNRRHRSILLRHAFMACPVILAFCQNASAQEALFSSLESETAIKERAFQVRNQYGLGKQKAVDFFVSPNTSIAYNDNVNTSSDDAEHDWIWSSGLSLGWVWQGKKNQSMTFSTGVSYSKYIRGFREDTMNIAPGSNLSYDHYWDRTHLNLHNNFSFSTDPTDHGEVSGQSQFGGYNNAAGLSVNHQISFASLNFGYDHVNFISTETTSDNNSRSTENFTASSSFQLRPYLSVGPDFSASFTKYKEGTLNDNRNLSYGFFADVTLTSTINLQGRVGLSQFEFESTGTLPSPGSQDSLYFSLNLSHELTDRILQSLNVSRSSRLGILSDTTTSDSLNYGLNWAAFQDISMSANGLVTKGDQGFETYRQYGVVFAINYRITERFSSSASYRYTLRESDQGGRNYTQNLATLSLSARF